MAYILSPLSKEHIQEAENYTLGRWGLLQSIDYIEQLLESCQLLSEFPNKGRVDSTYEAEELRIFPLKYHLIIYRIVVDDVEIVAIPRANKKPENFLK